MSSESDEYTTQGDRNLKNYKELVKKEYVKGAWSQEEDAALLFYVQKYGTKNWSLIASHISQRIGKQCRSRYYNHLDPNVNQSWWEEHEDRKIIEMQSQIGNKWAVIAHSLHGRTPNGVKNHCKDIIN
jgi:myb proto-oncogene protein